MGASSPFSTSMIMGGRVIFPTFVWHQQCGDEGMENRHSQVAIWIGPAQEADSYKARVGGGLLLSGGWLPKITACVFFNMDLF